MQNLGGVCCPICLQYLVKPITVSCGHSFCELCLEQYFLFLNYCPTCEEQIRDKKMSSSTALGQFIQNFVQKQHPAQYQSYRERIQKLKQWKKDRDFNSFKVGMKIDIRDQNYIWCEGIITRIISRIGQTQKILKIKFQNNDQQKQEQLKVNSLRLAKHGFYTQRNDITTYKKKQ